MFIVLIRRTCPGFHENILTPFRLSALRMSEWPLIFTDDLVIFSQLSLTKFRLGARVEASLKN